MSNIHKTNAEFKSGERVICNGNNESYILGYYTNDIVEVRLWRGQKHIGDVIAHEDDLIKVINHED